MQMLKCSHHGGNHALHLEYPMSNDKKNVNDRDGLEKNDPNRRSDIERKKGQVSQDALRHEQDAAHHKEDKNPQRGRSK
jgi:hypothetical protein